MPSYPITIHEINIAPEHQIFGKKDGVLDGSDIVSKNEVRLIENTGIEGDRFCKHRPESNGHVTFFSLEVWHEVQQQLDLSPDLRPALTRRNIIISGVDLKALYGQAFTIQDIQFLGTVHCAPCLGMNRALGPGARDALYSRGGLRAQVHSTGTFTTGDCHLSTDALINPKNAATQDPLPNLP